jgi:hypothetical protein
MPHACQGSVLRPRDPRRVPRAPDHLGTPVGVIRPPASRRSHLKPAHGPTVGKSWAVVAATLRKVKKRSSPGRPRLTRHPQTRSCSQDGSLHARCRRAVPSAASQCVHSQNGALASPEVRDLSPSRMYTANHPQSAVRAGGSNGWLRKDLSMSSGDQPRARPARGTS